MTATIKARMNRTSLRVTIPKFIADSLEIVNGTALEVKFENKQIVIVPVQTSKPELTQ